MGSSDILPIRLKKDGTYTAASSVAEEQELLRLSRHVNRKLTEYGQRILAGEVSLAPYELQDDNACGSVHFTVSADLIGAWMAARSAD